VTVFYSEFEGISEEIFIYLLILGFFILLLQDVFDYGYISRSAGDLEL